VCRHEPEELREVGRRDIDSATDPGVRGDVAVRTDVQPGQREVQLTAGQADLSSARIQAEAPAQLSGHAAARLMGPKLMLARHVDVIDLDPSLSFSLASRLKNSKSVPNMGLQFLEYQRGA